MSKGDAPEQSIPPPALEVALETDAERERAERLPRFRGLVARGDKLFAVFDGIPDKGIINAVKGKDR